MNLSWTLGLCYRTLRIRDIWVNGKFHSKLSLFWLGQTKTLAYHEVRKLRARNGFIAQAPVALLSLRTFNGYNFMFFN